jgi:hypothetical protein
MRHYIRVSGSAFGAILGLLLAVETASAQRRTVTTTYPMSVARSTPPVITRPALASPQPSTIYRSQLAAPTPVTPNFNTRVVPFTTGPNAYTTPVPVQPGTAVTGFYSPNYVQEGNIQVSTILPLPERPFAHR